MKPENQFIDSVHKHLPPESLLHREGMANPYRGGTADCWYSGVRDLWIEWKFVIIPKRDDTVIDINAGKKPSLSALQKDWLARRHDEGRNVWVGIGSKDGGVFLHHRSWEVPHSAESFRKMLRSRKELAQMITSFVQGEL